MRKGWGADGLVSVGDVAGLGAGRVGYLLVRVAAGWVLPGAGLMGSVLCGGGAGPWPPLPPEMVEDYEEWVAAGRPGLEEAETVVDAVEREAD